MMTIATFAAQHSEEILDILDGVHAGALQTLTRKGKWDVIDKAARNPGDRTSKAVRKYANILESFTTQSPEIQRALQSWKICPMCLPFGKAFMC